MVIPLLKRIIQNVTPQQTNVQTHQRQKCGLSLDISSPLLLLRYQSFHQIHFLCLLVLISLVPLYIKANKNKILTNITTCCCFETDCQIVQSTLIFIVQLRLTLELLIFLPLLPKMWSYRFVPPWLALLLVIFYLKCIKINELSD